MQKLSSSLSAKIILVAGNASRLSQGIIKSFLQAGAIVLAPACSLKEVINLKHYVGADTPGHLITQLLDVPDYDQAAAFTDTIIDRFGRIDLVVATIEGTDNPAGLSEVEMKVWQKMWDCDLNLYFICAHLALPVLRQTPGALFVSVCRSSSGELQPLAGLATFADTMRRSMAQLFSEEAAQQHTRYYHLQVPQPVRKVLAGKEPPLRPDYEWLGEHIIQLYTQPAAQVKPVFQFFPAVAGS